MNILRYLLPLIFASLAACSNGNEEEPSVLEINQNDIIQNFEAEVSSVFITVKSSGKFTATSSNPDWCRSEIEEGKETENLKISVTQNNLSDTRTAQILVEAQGASPIIIKINQSGEFLRFAVISDTHFGSSDAKDKVNRALRNILSENSQPDAIFVVGDLTNNSRISQYNDLIQVFEAQAPKSVPVYYMLGNHDWEWNDGNPLTIYTDKLKQPLNQYIEIKGFPFITISSRDPYQYPHYSSEEISFLSESLYNASRKYPGRPIFVFAHVGILNTVYGTGSSEGWGTNTLLRILTNYPQVILFSGHSHFPVGDPRSIHQRYFTSVNVGSTTYSEIEAGFTEGIHPPGFDKVTEGIIVNVKKNTNIEMERWDTYRNEEILPRWTVKAPHNGTAFTYVNRNGGNAPTFKESDNPVISNITTNSCTVSFPQATDDEVVHHYIVEISKNNNPVKTIPIFSQFYLNSEMPTLLETSITGLEHGTQYIAQITAVDSYNNKSGKITSAEFVTSN